MSIFNDKLRQAFGFQTSKEDLDQKIDNYKKHIVNDTEYSIATRKILISSVEERIRQIAIIIQNNQSMIDLYNKIKDKSIEKIEEPNNAIKVSLIDADGNIIMYANYKTLKDYLESLIKKGISGKTIAIYNKQLGEALTKMWMFYADIIIRGKGTVDVDGQYIENNYEIYADYVKITGLMNEHTLKDENRKAIVLDLLGINLIKELYEQCEKANNQLYLLLNILENNLEQLKHDQNDDEYTLKIIEETKQILRSSNEYFQAKASYDYLKETKRFKF